MSFQPPPFLPGRDETRAPQLAGSTLTVTILALVIVLVRLYTRLKVSRSVGWDDYTILAAMVGDAVGSDVLLVVEMHLGGFAAEHDLDHGANPIRRGAAYIYAVDREPRAFRPLLSHHRDFVHSGNGPHQDFRMSLPPAYHDSRNEPGTPLGHVLAHGRHSGSEPGHRLHHHLPMPPRRRGMGSAHPRKMLLVRTDLGHRLRTGRWECTQVRC